MGEDWLGIELAATLNRELDQIEQRNGEGFTPTFERDLAFKVASLAFAAFSARGRTQGGTMIAYELQQLLAADALTSLQSRLAAVEAERDAAGEALQRIEAHCGSNAYGSAHIICHVCLDAAEHARAMLAASPLPAPPTAEGGA